jgi:TonB family protein
MLDQLVESRNNHDENKRRGSFMLTTAVAAAAVLMSGWTYSLFAKNFAVGSGALEISSLLTPVAPEAPPVPEPAARPERSSAATSGKTVLTELHEEVGRTAPAETGGRQNVRDAGKYHRDFVITGPTEFIPSGGGERGQYAGSGIGGTPNRGSGAEDEEEAPVIRKPVKQESLQASTPVSGGVLNGKALSLIKPVYPAVALPVRAAGDVTVQVLIDETGKVVSAKAVSGHPLLRDAAVRAARGSTFTPTFLTNQPVKVTGVIIYKFNL